MRLSIHRSLRCQIPRQRFEQILRTAVRRYARQPRQLPPEFSLAVVGVATMRRTNRAYRRQNRVADVLSFPYGEVVICYPVARRHARAHGLALRHELALLFAHGLLHYLGFDHQTLRDRRRMAAAEEDVLGQSGLVSRAAQRAKVSMQKAKLQRKNQN